tara:strand:- start:78 stop:308 length:231 start_codon:yes stop_codon:yes gene_type:complete
MKKLVDNQIIEMTAEEVSAREAEEAIAIEEENTRQAEQTAKENAKVSGNQKLLDLGLTQAEASAMTGYTPLVADEE